VGDRYQIRDSLIAFTVFWVCTFVAVHFLTFFPLTILERPPLKVSLAIATFAGLCEALYALQKGNPTT
jgi:hypothetical protein